MLKEIYEKRVVRTFDLGSGWRIQVEYFKHNYKEFWIYRNTMGIKMLMFGLECDECEIVGLIENNYEGYRAIYEEEYND